MRARLRWPVPEVNQKDCQDTFCCKRFWGGWCHGEPKEDIPRAAAQPGGHKGTYGCRSDGVYEVPHDCWFYLEHLLKMEGKNGS